MTEQPLESLIEVAEPTDSIEKLVADLKTMNGSTQFMTGHTNRLYDRSIEAIRQSIAREEAYKARIAELEAGLRVAVAAINSAYMQAGAEYQNRDTRAARHDKDVEEARAKARALLNEEKVR